MKEKRIIKIALLLFSLVIIIPVILVIIGIKSIYNSDIDSCLDRGYCWDYIRNRCEEKDQGFCVKSKQDCIDRHGKWQEDIQYCILK